MPSQGKKGINISVNSHGEGNISVTVTGKAIHEDFRGLVLEVIAKIVEMSSSRIRLRVFAAYELVRKNAVAFSSIVPQDGEFIYSKVPGVYTVDRWFTIIPMKPDVDVDLLRTRNAEYGASRSIFITIKRGCSHIVVHHKHLEEAKNFSKRIKQLLPTLRGGAGVSSVCSLGARFSPITKTTCQKPSQHI